MKRWIHASHTYGMEPSGYEYGKALEQGHKRLQDRYAPFEVNNVYFYSGLANSTGYRITLSLPGGVDPMEWIAHNSNAGSFRSANYVLYGPFYDHHVKGLTELKDKDKLGEFKSLDSVMSYLFSNYDDEIEEYTWDINDPLYPEELGSGKYKCPNCKYKFKDTPPRCPECGQKLIWD